MFVPTNSSSAPPRFDSGYDKQQQRMFYNKSQSVADPVDKKEILQQNFRRMRLQQVCHCFLMFEGSCEKKFVILRYLLALGGGQVLWAGQPASQLANVVLFLYRQNPFPLTRTFPEIRVLF